MLDPWLPCRTERPVCTVPSLLLEHLELLQEQGGGEEPAGPPVATRFHREARRGQRRIRSAGVGETHDAEDLGGRRPAEGNALPLSKSVQAPDAVDRSLSGASQDRPADLFASHPHQDVPAVPSGRSDGEDAGLGGRRMRRLYAKLKIRRGGHSIETVAVAANIRNEALHRNG